MGNKEGGGNNPRTFRMEFPAKTGPMPFPVEGCNDRAATRMVMRVHLWNRHVQDTVAIIEEGKLPHPW